MSLHDPALALAHVDRIIGLRQGALAFDLTAPDVIDAMLHELYRPVD